MIKAVDYNKVPENFAHCLAKDCKRADSCLRYQISRFIPNSMYSVRIVNPFRQKQGDNCSEYLSDVLVKVTYGWNHMFDKLIHEKAVAIKKELSVHYGKTEFYRLKRSEKGFSLEEQEYVKNVFLRNGIKEDPVYDEVRYEYVWYK